MIKIKIRLNTTVYVSYVLTWSHDMTSQLSDQNDPAIMTLETSPPTSPKVCIEHEWSIFPMYAGILQTKAKAI